MKKAKLFMMLALLVMGVSNLFAQNVTISPSTGSLIAALTEDVGTTHEVGYEKGWCAMWRHEQLPLTFTVSDYPNLRDNGEILRPAGNISKYKPTPNDSVLVIGGGEDSHLYCVLSLPKGYRITGYRLVLVNNLNGKTGDNAVNGMETASNITNVMYETDKYFNTSSYKARGKYEDGSYEMGPTNSEDEYVIERMSNTETDMGNQLYFILTHNNQGFYDVTIKYFEVYFTAEGTFPVTVSATGKGQGTSLVTSSFQTSKIDVGEITMNEKTPQGSDTPVKLFSYNYQNVKDLDGEIYLYQQDAVNEDGAPADVATNKHIYPIKTGDNTYQYAFENDVYYVEPPVTVNTSSGASCPIGYRVVGATFKYMWGDEVDPSTETVSAGSCLIQYDYYGYKYYLRTRQTPELADNDYYWKIDELGNIYYIDGSTTRYLACSGEGNRRFVTTSTIKDNKFNLRRDPETGYIYYNSGNNKYYLCYYEGGNWEWGGLRVIKNGTTNLLTSTVSSDAQQIEVGGFTPGQYTLKIYDKTGKNVEKEVTVKSKNDADTYEMLPCNNDAIKFEISGLTGGAKAMVEVTLKLEALDPYINSMNIVCEDAEKHLQMSQTFTASDFRVSGGAFEFYIPKKYSGETIDLSFADLYSNYGDSTYYNNKESIHRSRYSYVTSSYFIDNLDLYASTYNPVSDYKTKVITSTAGNIRFKFNNAEDLLNTQQSTVSKSLMEYPFTYNGYINSDDPDGSNKKGKYDKCQVTAGNGTQPAGKFFVFTADEPRYNIAPGYTTKVDGEDVTTPHAWQHRSYAFYRMDIKVTAKDFDPVFVWDPIYDKTFYLKDGQKATDSMWGLTLKTMDGDNEVKGYVNYEDIINIIPNGRPAVGTEGEEGYIPAIPVQLDPNNVNAPASMKQILYIDGTNLHSIAKSKEKKTVDGEEKTISHDESELKDLLGENALIFLPKGNTSTADNVAYISQSNNMVAGHDIVIADKNPFYSPYDIQVDPARYAMYDRELTNEPLYGDDDQNLTIVLPFEINVNGQGIHTNNDKTGKPFRLATMNNEGNSLSKNSSEDFFADGYFTMINEKSEPNKPYVVTMQGGGSESSFKVHVNGSLVKATPSTPSITGILTGESATGDYTYKENNVERTAHYSFTHEGTYTGIEIGEDGKGGAAKASTTVFYFANNFFLDSKTLGGGKSLKVFPFRSYYDYTGSGAAAKLHKFRIVFGENPFAGTNGISDVKRDADLAVIPGKGVITLMARADKDVTLHAVSGITVDKCSLRAGETRTVSVPAGVYVINGVKMVVK